MNANYDVKDEEGRRCIKDLCPTEVVVCSHCVNFGPFYSARVDDANKTKRSKENEK